VKNYVSITHRKLYARFLKFLNLNKIIHENQIGFKEESRNTDHIFTLKSIIEIFELDFTMGVLIHRMYHFENFMWKIMFQ
jgi:hypothetical protein